MAYDLLFQDDVLQATFFGNLTAVPDPPSRLVNIFLSSTKSDFEFERRQLHEVVLPQLQKECSSLGLDMQLVDIQSESQEDAFIEPHAITHHLEEIEDCHRTSLGCFFLCLMGNKSRPQPLPSSLLQSVYPHIRSAASDAGLDASLLDNHYLLDTNLQPPRYVLQHHDNGLKEPSNKIETDSEENNWPEEEEKLVRIIQYGTRIAIQEGLIDADIDTAQFYLLSGVHSHLKHALKLCKNDTSRIICAVRQFEGIDASDSAAAAYTDSSTIEANLVEEDSAQKLIEEVILNVDRHNVAYFSIPWCKSGLDPEFPDHSAYLKSFSEVVSSKLKSLINTAADSWSPKWDLFPTTYRKIVQEVFRESQSHLLNSRRYLRELGMSQSLESDCGALLHIQRLMMGEDEKLRHSPIIVCGGDGCGKSTLLSQVITYCTEWLGGDVIRIVRHAGQSPCSTYTSELLRNLCLHITLAFNFELKHHSFELGELSIWFQDLLKMVESTPTELVIILDDLHLLRSPHSSILGWLPWHLPPNAHLVCSLGAGADELLRLLRARVPHDAFVALAPVPAPIPALASGLRDAKRAPAPDQWALLREGVPPQGASTLYVRLLARIVRGWSSWSETEKLTVPASVEEAVECLMAGPMERFGFRTLRKMATFLACTTYGLRENELVELLADAAMDDGGKHSRRPAATWFAAFKEMKPLLKEYYVDRRPYLHWSHNVISKYIMNKYLKTARDLQACYTELANAFDLGFLMEKQKEENNCRDPSKRKDDWCDILREMDELWFHLLRSGDREKLKKQAICNFDFLQCAISGASVSYVRSLLELVKCHMLDWEVELLLAVTKQAVEVLSQDPSQLATELLNWLKPFADFSDSPSVKSLLSNALKFCHKSTLPRLVPTNAWLSLSLPLQVTTMTLPHPIAHIVTTPDSQHSLCAADKDISMFHLPSKNLVKTFKGHKAAITCLHVTSSGQWLVSGSEDTDVVVWNIETGQMKHRMCNHISGVLCATSTHSESLVLSGSEMGVVLVASLDTGQVLQRLEKHRGLISSIAVNSGDDIFATGSSDKTVCVWSLEDFSLLNTITLPSAIRRMDISRDSTFLALACGDQSLHVRSLTTGSEVHRLPGAGAEVTAVCFGHDHCRCVVGCADGRCHVFDVHSATLINTLAGHSEAICSVQVQPNDAFLVTAGGNKVVVWNFTAPKKEFHSHFKQKVKRLDSHREPILCLTVSKDGSLAISGSKDNLVKVWDLTTGLIRQSIAGHKGPVTCVAFAPNGLFAVSGSEDTTLCVFSPTSGQVDKIFKEHQAKVVSVCVAFDSRRVLSVDGTGCHRLWTADALSQLYAAPHKPSALVSLHSNIVFCAAGKNDSSLKFWPLMDFENEKCVSHSDSILCYAVTHDCKILITGSNDMSLKVWEVETGKLTQVLAGHDGSVTCVALAPLSPSLVVSGSSDCTLILWDMLLGSDNFTFRGHTDTVKCAALTPDGTTLLSGSSDNTIQLWNTQTGERISMLDLHAQLVQVSCSFNLNQVIVQLAKSSSVPILRLHNNPAKGITIDMLPGHQEDLLNQGPAGVLPKRVLLRGNLKREQSFDSLYWDLKSSSPRHDTLLDDLKRSPAPGVWDGRHPTKPKLAKHKLLKKQQSMFAFFPDHQSPPAPSLEARKADLLARIQVANRQMMDPPAESPAEQPEGEKRPDVAESTVCAVS